MAECGAVAEEVPESVQGHLPRGWGARQKLPCDGVAHYRFGVEGGTGTGTVFRPTACPLPPASVSRARATRRRHLPKNVFLTFLYTYLILIEI